MLPLDKEPQVTTWTGNVLMSAQGESILRLRGIFKDASRPGYEPSLQLGDKTILPFERTNQELAFKVSNSILSHRPISLSYTTAKINVPYYKSFFRRKENRQFEIGFILLPEKSGTFKLFQSNYITQTLSRQESCLGITFSGHEDAIRGCPVPEGWSVDIENVRAVLTKESGDGFGHDHWDLGYLQTHTAVKKHIRSDGDESLVIYDFYYVVTKPETIPFDQPLAEDHIRWGDSKIYTITGDQATWKAVYTQPDGRQIGFASSSEASQYIHVKQISNQLVVTMAPFD
jgi:hypothetical protein